MKSEPEMMVAVLHDVVEDSDWTLEQLREKGVSEEVLEAEMIPEMLFSRRDETSIETRLKDLSTAEERKLARLYYSSADLPVFVR